MINFINEQHALNQMNKKSLLYGILLATPTLLCIFSAYCYSIYDGDISEIEYISRNISDVDDFKKEISNNTFVNYYQNKGSPIGHISLYYISENGDYYEQGKQTKSKWGIYPRIVNYKSESGSKFRIMNVFKYWNDKCLNGECENKGFIRICSQSYKWNVDKSSHCIRKDSDPYGMQQKHNFYINETKNCFDSLVASNKMTDVCKQKN